MRLIPSLLLLPAAALATATPFFDEGYDFAVLDMPHRAVVGDTLKFAVRGRPSVQYAVLCDLGRKLHPWNGVFFHLDFSPALSIAALGLMPATGSAHHALVLPSDPVFENLKIYFQAFVGDPGIPRLLGASDGKTLELLKDTQQPLITQLTVNKISRDQNGVEIDEGMLWVPLNGFTIDLAFDTRGKGPIDPASLVITADKTLGLGAISPGTNLAQFFTFANGNATASATVASAWAFPLNTVVTLSASIKNQNGNVSPTETYAVKSDVWRTYTQPFAQKQLWYLEFDRHDLDQSGIKDFREDLVLFGLGNAAAATSGPSFEVNLQARKEVLTQLKANYGIPGPDQPNIDFFIAPPGGIFATICVGGRNGYPVWQLPPGAKETTGAAYVNQNNRTKDLFVCDGFLGVHPRSIFHLFKDVPAFQNVFGPLQQNPVGNDPDDLIVTQPGFDPQTGTPRQRVRYTEIQQGVRAFARATAFVLTQETSHAMGLVPPGRLNMNGLLGGDYYGHSTNWHSDDGRGDYMSGNNSTPAPAEPQNLALIWDHFQSGRGHFSAISWAYLRERVINQ